MLSLHQRELEILNPPSPDRILCTLMHHWFAAGGFKIVRIRQGKSIKPRLYLIKVQLVPLVCEVEILCHYSFLKTEVGYTWLMVVIRQVVGPWNINIWLCFMVISQYIGLMGIYYRFWPHRFTPLFSLYWKHHQRFQN